MKKLTLLIILMLSTIAIKAQDVVVEDGALKMVSIIEDTGLTIQETHDMVQLHLAEVFNDANHTCKIDSPSQLLYKGVFDVATLNLGLLYYTPFDLNISIKDNRMRVVITISEVRVESGYLCCKIVDAYPINEAHDMMKIGLSKKQSQKVYDGAVAHMRAMVEGIEKCLEKTYEDEW